MVSGRELTGDRRHIVFARDRAQNRACTEMVSDCKGQADGNGQLTGQRRHIVLLVSHGVQTNVTFLKQGTIMLMQGTSSLDSISRMSSGTLCGICRLTSLGLMCDGTGQSLRSSKPLNSSVDVVVRSVWLSSGRYTWLEEDCSGSV